MVKGEGFRPFPHSSAHPLQLGTGAPRPRPLTENRFSSETQDPARPRKHRHQPHRPAPTPSPPAPALQATPQPEDPGASVRPVWLCPPPPPTRQPPWPQDRSRGTGCRVRSEGHPWPSRVAQLLSLQSRILSLGLEAGPPSVYPNDPSPLRPCADPWLHSPSHDQVSKTFFSLNILFQNPHVHPEP